MSIPDLPPAPLKWENQPSTATPFDAEVLNPWGDAVMAGAEASQNYAQIAQQAAQDAQAPTDQAMATALATDGSDTRTAADELYAAPTGVDSARHVTPDSGNDVSTDLTTALEAAATAATYGAGTLILRPGDYLISNTVTIPTGVTLHGLTGATLLCEDNTTILALSSGATVENVRFQGTNPGIANLGGQNAIRAVGTGTDRITNITVRDCHFEAMEGYGLLLRFVEGFQVVGNTFTGTGMSAIGAICVTDGLIDANRIHGTGQLPAYSANSYGLSLSLQGGTIDPVTNYPPARVRVTNNVITNQAWEALDTHGGDDITFRGNIIIGCEMGVAVTQKEGLVDGGPGQVVVSGNVINSEGWDPDRVRAGISVNGASTSGSTKHTGVTVTGNIVKGHGAPMNHPAQPWIRSGGIALSDIASAVVADNVIIDALGNGISLRNAGTATVAGNIFQTVWRETADTRRTSTLVYLDNAALTVLTGNALAEVASDLPNRNESTVRVVSGAGTVKAVGNSWDPQTSAAAFSIRNRTPTGVGVGIPDSTMTVPNYQNTEAADPQGAFTSESSGETIHVPGIYRLEGGVQWASSGSGRRGLYLRVNGSTVAANQAPSWGSGPMCQNVSRTVALAAGDTVDLAVWQDTGDSLVVEASLSSFRSITLIREATA